MNSSSLLLEERTKALGWLTHGGELAVDLKGDRARHSDVIWQLIVEAVEVIDKTPDNERRWLTSGQRSGGWNMIGMTREDLVEIVKDPAAFRDEAIRWTIEILAAAERC